jgi:hypothetical protein
MPAREDEKLMRNIVVAIAFTATLGFVGAAAWQAEAVPLTVTPAPVDVAKPIQPAACGGPGRYCPPGRHWVCGPYGHHCWCARC